VLLNENDDNNNDDDCVGDEKAADVCQAILGVFIRLLAYNMDQRV